MSRKRVFLLDGLAMAYRSHFAFIRRPLEWGEGGPQEGEPDREKIDVVATDVIDLAKQMGA